MNKTKWRNFKTWLNWFIYAKFNSKDQQMVQDMVNKAERNNEEAVAYVLQNVQEIIGFLPEHSETYLKDKVILEIGPGQDIGILLVLLGLGAKHAYIIDPFFYEWNDQLHSGFYSDLLKKAKQIYSACSFSVLEKIIENKSYSIDEIAIIRTSLEDSKKIPSNSIDVSFSNACFEHLADSEKGIETLSRITKNGGIGFHQVDMRDHRDFDKPLEFLSFSSYVYRSIKSLSKCCLGNRLRPYEFQYFFEQHHFSCVFKPNMFADELYLNDVSSRFSRRYKKVELEKIRAICGRFFIKKID